IMEPPGRTFAHVEFTRDGRYALASVSEQDGAIVVIDAETLAEVRRLPMKKPVGKYNVWNKIMRSEGTSHSRAVKGEQSASRRTVACTGICLVPPMR
ncbi:MAG: hypothetical protein JNK68_17345, partial [Betaproteobacteria bacterium]|nr:hypothetical protein [Betaproteobacteria bacterium]